MNIVWLLLFASQAAAADWMREVRERGAKLESEHQWEQAGDVYRTALTKLGPGGSHQDRFWLLTSLGELSFEQHEYGLARHKGYSTPEHMEALSRFGPTALHRFTFEPVRLHYRDTSESAACP